MKIKKFFSTVEYNTLAGYLRTWEGYAEDEGDAIYQAIDESYFGLSSNENFSSKVSFSMDEEDFIEVEE